MPLEAYLRDLARRDLRPIYIYNQRLTLRRLVRFLDPGPLLEARSDELTAYLDSRPQTPAARGVEIAHLRGFYRWALDEELLTTDPSRRLIRPRQRRLLPRPMPETDLSRALQNPPERVGPILYLALYAGLRACEIAQLRAEDLTGGIIVINESKGGGMSSVPLAPRLAQELARYPLPTRGWLFPRLDGRPGHLSRSRIGQLANQYLHDLGIPSTLHTLRHAFGTNVYRISRDLRQTQELLRHQSPSTTAGYTWIDPVGGHAVLAMLT